MFSDYSGAIGNDLNYDSIHIPAIANTVSGSQYNTITSTHHNSDQYQTGILY